MNISKEVDEYIAGYPAHIQVMLKQVRATVRDAAPEAEEAFKYKLPTYVLNGNLVHFGAFKNHIGLYATPSGNIAFDQELSDYQVSKGAVRFPINQPLPLDLISRIVKYRVKENLVL